MLWELALKGVGYKTHICISLPDAWFDGCGCGVICHFGIFIPRMADNNNNTNCKLLFVSNFIVLDYLHEGCAVCDKHRFCDLQSPCKNGLYRCLIYVEIVSKVLNRETVTPNVILCLSTVTPW